MLNIIDIILYIFFCGEYPKNRGTEYKELSTIITRIFNEKYSNYYNSVVRCINLITHNKTKLKKK